MCHCAIQKALKEGILLGALDFAPNSRVFSLILLKPQLFLAAHR